MSSQSLVRTQYMNLSTNTVRGGSTADGESLTDLENYILPWGQMLAANLHLWGVADGLEVSATANQADLVIAPGVALDVAGRLISLAAGGFAITDPAVDPNQVQNVPLAGVDNRGITLATAGLSGEYFLTAKWREALGQGQLANVPTMLHTPWLRLQPAATYQDTGEQVVLARVTLDQAGRVQGLAPGGRRQAGLPAERIELRRAVAGKGLSIGHSPAADMLAPGQGGLEIRIAQAAEGDVPAWRSALTVDAAAAQLALLPGGGSVGIAMAAPDPAYQLDVRGAIHAGSLRVDTAQVTELSAGTLGAKTFSATDARIDVLTVSDMSVDRLDVPIQLRAATIDVSALLRGGETLIAAGQTPPGGTEWEQYNAGTVLVRVDTRQAGFTRTPIYVCAIGGNSNHWETTGGSSIYEEAAGGFTIYVRYWNDQALTPAQANIMGWHINWIGMQL